MHRLDLMAAALYLTVAVATGFVDLRTRPFPDHVYKAYIPGVVNATYGAPGIYRVLAPYTVWELMRLTRANIASVWLATRLAAIFVSLLVFHWYMRTWFGVPGALGATLFVAASLPLTFTNSWAHPDQIPELMLFTLGCGAIARGRDVLFAVTLVLATLNRETAVFLVPLYLIAGQWSRERVLKTALFGVLWVAVFGGLRAILGFEGYEYWQFGKNIEALKLLPPPRDPYYRAYGWFFVALFGPVLWIALRDVAAKPLFVRRALWIVPAFLAVAFTISSIIETRIFTPLYPLVVPAAAFSFSRGGQPVKP
jgi:hypothetical protein